MEFQRTVAKLNDLGLPNVDLDLAFRIGKANSKPSSYTRPIKIGLIRLPDKEKLLQLKGGAGINFSEDLLQELLEKRTTISSLATHFRKLGKSVTNKGTHAIIDGQ